MSKTVLFQTIRFSKQKQFHLKIFSFNISTQVSSIWSIERTLSGATTPGQSGSGSDGNEGVLCIPQNSNITETSPSDCLVSYQAHALGESYISA